MVKKSVVVIFVFGLLISFITLPSALAGDKTSDIIKALRPNYQEWLKLVNYIITPQEKEVFLSLNNDLERDLFIETFWKMRDPTPGTPKNEYKEEIIERFNYVNRMFKSGTVREGWQSDMGRIYMVLGPPASIERFEGVNGIVPCQAWTFHGDPEKGLPAVFILLFFQKHGGTEYKLYDPLADGPASLLQDKRGLEILTSEEIYEKIKEIAPTLANTSISMIPGEFHYDYSASPRHNIILAEILNSPKKDINPSYATHFLNYRGVVSTEYLTNYIDSDTLVEVFPDPITGLNFVHFAIAPKTLSVDYYEPNNQFYIPFLMDVSLRLKDEIVFQYSRNMSFYFSEEEIDRIKGNGIALEDTFPASEGNYQLTVLLRNPSSKEFTILEKEIEVREIGNQPFLSGPVLGYRTERYPRDQHLPFKISDTKILVDPKNTISASELLVVGVNVVNLNENLRQKGKIKIEIRGLGAENQIVKEQEIYLSEKEFSRIANYFLEIPLMDIRPDYYELNLSLVNPRGEIIDQLKKNFIISYERLIGHPIIQAKSFNLKNLFYYYYMLASQYNRLEQSDKASYYYELAFQKNPEYKEGLKDYCQFLIKTNRFERVLELAEGLKAEDSDSFDYHLFRGLALSGQERYDQALEELLKAVTIYDSDTRVLNALGTVYLKTGQINKARQALEASLRLNPDQAEIRKLLSELEKG